MTEYVYYSPIFDELFITTYNHAYPFKFKHRTANLASLPSLKDSKPMNIGDECEMFFSFPNDTVKIKLGDVIYMGEL